MTEEERREHLELAVERSEGELREAVDDLATAVRTELSLRNRVTERPLAWALGAFALGAWLGRR